MEDDLDYDVGDYQSDSPPIAASTVTSLSQTVTPTSMSSMQGFQGISISNDDPFWQEDFTDFAGEQQERHLHRRSVENDEYTTSMLKQMQSLMEQMVVLRMQSQEVATTTEDPVSL